MRVIEPHHLHLEKKPNKSRSIWKLISLCLALLIIVTTSLGVWAYTRPLPIVTPKTVTVTSFGQPVDLDWPNYGQSAVGQVGYGLLASTDNQKPVPIASIAKVITALSVLQVKPLSSGKQGPTITLTQADVDLYDHYVAVDGSVTPINVGEKISEYQALQAMMLPSSNNMADSMAIWAFGSVEAYTDYANNWLRTKGLVHTKVADASGFSPHTVSTADDLVKIGELAMKESVLATIVGQKSATLPVAGQVHNVNVLLGSNSIVGIKTGNTDQAGGCFLFAAKHQVNGQSITLVGAVLGGPVLASALNSSPPLIDSTYQNFKVRKVVAKGDVLGYYDLPWGGQVTAVAATDISQFAWKGSQLRAQVSLENVKLNTLGGSNIGQVKLGARSSAILLSSKPTQPTWRWRLWDRYFAR